MIAGALALTIVAACTAGAFAAPAAAPAAPPASASMTDGAPGGGHLRVGIDPETGLPTAPAPQGMLEPLWSFRLRPALDQLPVLRMEDGSLMVDLNGIYLTDAVAQLGWDGRPTFHCAEHGWMAPLWMSMVPARPAAPAWAEE